MDEWSHAPIVEFGQRLLELMTFSAPLVQTKIADRAKQPRPQCQRGATRLIVLTGQCTMRAHHRVLNDFLRVECVLQNPVRIAVKRRLEALDQPLERSRLAAMNRDGKVFLRILERAGSLAAGPRVLHGSYNTSTSHSVR